ncbi:hypothetical protein GUJ93_ZPchr0002g25969 [Zizania palustris]|uniref:Cell wall hydroxyproline-rich glycoprotein n=1 Tax=Zizania palustris TaxID=103762 RepID=A0A8J5S1K3_ZIZPA|nr:hypothetical protein GUJ93_ZPchr0002g25969 [Zizania palustris]
MLGRSRMVSRSSAVAAGGAAAAVVLVLLGVAAAQHEGNVSEEYAASFASRFDAPPSWTFPNPRLRAAYAALQAWKQTAIFSDPANFTANWVGPNVCGYNGIFCALATGGYGGGLVVAGIDLNHADIAGYLPASLPLGLPDLALIHLNSNRFCGVVPDTFRRLRLLHELDLSNNRFVGAFPEVVLALPSLRYLDLRFNDFEGSIPPALFDRPLDAIFLNSNRLRNPIPANLGNSPASVVVLAHNRLGGCIPPSIGKMANTLNEIVLINDELTGCVPPQVGLLKRVTVFDVSDNHLQGPLPASIAGMAAVEELDVAMNLFEGAVPVGVCGLASLKNFTYTDNFITSRPSCAVATADGAWNCIPGAPAQRPPSQCAAAAAHPFDCTAAHAGRLACERRWCWESTVLLPLATAGLHHAILPGATQRLEHSVLPIATDERHHSIIPLPLAAWWLNYTILPVAAGIHHPILPIAAVQLHDPVLPLAASGAHHAIIPVTTLKLHHSVIPLATAEHAYSVLPVAAGRHHNASSTRTASTNRGRQARRAVRAPAGLVRSQPLNPSVLQFAAVTFLRLPAAFQPTRRVATDRAPRLRAASPRAGSGDPYHVSITLTALHPIVAIWSELPPTDDANNNAAFATQLLAAVSR